jgi:hypothetical protein
MINTCDKTYKYPYRRINAYDKTQKYLYRSILLSAWRFCINNLKRIRTYLVITLHFFNLLL